VSKKAQAALLEWRELSKFKEPDDFIFSMEKGKPHGDKWLIRALPAAFEDAKIKGAGRNLVVHSFRHTYVTMMENLTTQEEVRLLSGHATEKARKVYSHPSVEDLMGKLGTASAAVEKIWSK
jgi:integrase